MKIAIGTKKPDGLEKKRKSLMPPLLMVAVTSKKKVDPDEADEPEYADPVEEAAEEREETEERKETSGEVAPNPMALQFRSESSTCQYCEYMKGKDCTHPMISMPVEKGDSCSAFEPKEESVENYDAGGMNLEGTEE